MDIESLTGKILNADCMDVLRQLPNKCIDLVLTDPPYGGGAKAEFQGEGEGGKFGQRFDRYRNEYQQGGGISTRGGGSRNTTTHIKPNSGRQKRYADRYLAGGGQISATRTGGTWATKYTRSGEGDTDISYWDVAPSQDVFDEIFRVSKNQIIWGGNYFALPPTRCFNVWDKFIPEKFTMAMAEYAWTSFNANAKIWKYAPQDPTRFHPTQKPVALICRQLEEYTKEGDLILDCFSGSGTTAIACHRLHRRFICIERDEVYWRKSCERLEREQMQMTLL